MAARKKIGCMKIDHIGIAVASLAESIPLYTALVGQGPNHFEEVVSEKVKTAFFAVGESHLELLEATDPTSPIAQFLTKKGRGGIHHICVKVDNIHNKLAELKAVGIQLIDEVPKRGAHGKWVAFIHPKSMGGVLVELSQEDDV